MYFLPMRFYNKYHFQKGLNGHTTLNKSQYKCINVTGCRIFNISAKMAGFVVPFMKNVSAIGRVKDGLRNFVLIKRGFKLNITQHVYIVIILKILQFVDVFKVKYAWSIYIKL